MTRPFPAGRSRPAVLRQLLAAAGAAGASICTLAATIPGADYEQLTAKASRQGAVPVSVRLMHTSLRDLKDQQPALRAAAAQRAQRVLAELGAEAWEGGRSDNGIGSLELYVTPAGLAALARSTDVQAVTPGKPWHRRESGGLDGRFRAIERQIEQQGHADLLVTLDVPGVEFDVAKNGQVAVHAPRASAAEARQRAQKLLARLGDNAVLGDRAAAMQGLADAPAASGDALRPQLAVRVSLQGLLQLADSPLVRDLRLAGTSVPAPVFDPEAFAVARRDGFADVLLSVQNPLDSRVRSAAADEAQRKSLGRLTKTVLAELGPHEVQHEFTSFGTVAVRLSLQQLEAIKASGDLRLRSIELDKPVATPLLSTSARLQMNMPTAWAVSSYRGKSRPPGAASDVVQNIVVMDTGVQNNHRMFTNTGSSRVVVEACFGSTKVWGGVSYRTNCKDAYGAPARSSFGPGVAAPVWGCQANVPGAPNGECSHGTHVAAITAGGEYRHPTYGTLQGVAPDANIVAAQVFSYDINRVHEPIVFASDLLAAMEKLVQSTAAGTFSNPFTVNLSLGGGYYNTPCTAWSGDAEAADKSAFATAVATLKARGVPVIASTGNNGIKNAISWPACVPGVIKVASLVNDAAGGTISSSSNLVNPGAFPWETFWFAPGGGGATAAAPQTFVWSAAFHPYSTSEVIGMNGTSQAAPHIAGLYAAVKGAILAGDANGISVDGIYTVLANFGAVQDGPQWDYNDCEHIAGPGCVSGYARYKKVRLP